VKLRVAALLLALVVVGATAGAADARRSDNRKKPILFIHGFDLDDTPGYDCGSYWGKMRKRFRDFGQKGQLVTIAYYGGDRNCTHWLGHHGKHSRHHGHRGRSHDANTSIRHLGYHLAWTIWSHYSRRGKRVDLVGHSMGGLIVRYALAQVERNHPRFPRYLLVEDAVTLGTPHAGSGWAVFCGWKQCDEMTPGSGFMDWLRTKAGHPDGRGRTDWSTIGSHSDYIVSAASANSMNSDHRLKYLQSNEPAVGHMDYLRLGSKRITADVERWNRPGPWRTDYTSHWPIRRADLAVTFGNR
jgi:pimeloyl-ACP methyl ester carboxylesterase